MFTGIIEEVGEVTDIAPRGDSAVLTVRAAGIVDDLVHGASIAVNGVCLTVVGWDVAAEGGKVTLDFDVMGETLARSVIGTLAVGDPVNLERAVRADARLDGHVVQGHVDGTGTVISRTPGNAWESVRFGLPAELARFVAEKGSVAVDGVSLTVSAVGPDWFEVGLIPETLRATTLGGREAGSAVNLEVDVLAKYVARLMETS
ncbi:riboflavin synthase [uncultured Jatrophihabitans sp.]|uniref:riboflavin synthase n=1 Tax=uncultured Jatrophihabitans sp. TaxID=1610747 RepID=UPI0035C9CD56